MSQAPNVVVVKQNESNGIGTAGFVFSLLGWLTCGLLCIPGAVLSFLGLFSRGSKGLAIAGLIVGFPGVVFFLLIGMGTIAGVLGIGAAATQAVADAKAKMDAEQVAAATELLIEPDQFVAKIETPENAVVVETTDQTQVDPVEPPTSEPVPDYRSFSDAAGKFSVEAAAIDYKNGYVLLRRKDTGKEMSVQASKLSQADQDWLAERFAD